MNVKSILRAQATPLTIGLFLISAVSGVALFLHVGTTWFREMHEILSLVLLVPVVLHIWRNWLPLKIYMRNVPLYVGLAVSLVLAVPFVMEAASGGASGGNPMFAMVEKLEAAPISALAPALGMTAEEAVKRLSDGGIPAATADGSVAEAAKAAGMDAFEAFALLTQPATPATP